MRRTLLALATLTFLLVGCSDKKGTENKTTADKTDGTAKSAMGTVVKRKTSGELCEGENCPGHIK